MIGELLLDSARRDPDHPALVFPGTRHTYLEVAEAAANAARSLAGLGVRRGDRVGLLMPNCPDFVFTLFGAQLLGAVAVPVNTRYRARELAHVLGHAGIGVLVTSDVVAEHVDYVARLHETFDDLAGDPYALRLARAPALRTIAVLGETAAPGLLDRTAFDAAATDHVATAASGRDPALMLFTSGTTAMPKGCVLTHEAVVRGWLGVGERLEITRADVVYDPLPLFHMGGIGPLLFTFAAGATLLNQPHFEPGQGLELIERERATFLYTMFPPVTTALMRHPSFPDRDRSSVRALMNVAPPDTLDTITRAFAPALHAQGPFGMTEAGGAITCNALADPDRLATTGSPLPGMEVRVIDPATGTDLPPFADGELLVRGIGLFSGYHDDPEATAAAVDAEGWLHTGDRGHLDDQGRVVYVGRIKEMLKVGGENVAPGEVESLLSTLDAVKLALVVGVPDERLDEVVAAVIELAPGAELTEREVIDYCRGKIAGFKVPRHVAFVTDWPMSATKVQRYRVRERLLESLTERAR